MKKCLHIPLLVLFLLLYGPSACDLIEKEPDRQAVARAFDKYLYQEDLLEVIPRGISPGDSAAIARSYIDKWVRRQLMLNRAEEALTEEQKDVQKKIEEYRSSLLIYSYRQKLLMQKMDTVVTGEEIRSYYENNIDNFILGEEIVKATFIQVPLTAPDIGSVRNWIRSSNVDDLDKLEKYCFNYAEKFDMFNDAWIYFSALMKEVPLTIDRPDRFLLHNKFIDTSDERYHYFVFIRDFKAEGDIIPLELIRNDINSILLNKRKIEFYSDLEKRVYNEGVTHHQFEIYDNP